MLDKILEKVNSDLLTDEIKLEMGVMFEQAVNAAVTEKELALDEQNKQEILEFKEELVGKIDEYIAYLVEEISKEKEEKIEESAKIETAQNVLEAFDSMIKQFNMKLDPQSIDENVELIGAKQEISEKTEEILTLRKTVSELKRNAIVESVASNLTTENEKEKFKEVAKSVSMNEGDIAGFEKKLVYLSESIKKEVVTPIVEDIEDPSVTSTIIEESEKPEGVKRYMKYLSR